MHSLNAVTHRYICLSFCPLSFFYYYFKDLFLAVLSLDCCVWAFSSGSEQGLLLVARGLLTCGFSLWSTGARCVGSVIVAHGLCSCGLQTLQHRLSSCGARA